MKRRYQEGRFLSQKEITALQRAVEAARGKSQRQPPTQREVEEMAVERLLKSAEPPKRLRRKVAQHFNLNEAVGRAEAMIIMHAIEVHGSKRAAAKQLRISASGRFASSLPGCAAWD